MIKPATVSINSHIENLKQQVREQNIEQLDHLIIAHRDDTMIERVKAAFSGKNFAVVAIPQNCWSPEGDEIGELVDWSVSELGVNRIVLVGHSLGGTPVDNVQVCSNTDSASTRRVGSLIDRVNTARKSVKQCEQHFIRELECLQQLSLVRVRLLRDSKMVQGLFYRAESGVFCYYQPETRSFQALLNNNFIG